MGSRRGAQGALFYDFSLEDHVPADHLLRSIDRFVDLTDVRRHLSPFYSATGRPRLTPRTSAHDQDSNAMKPGEPRFRVPGYQSKSSASDVGRPSLYGSENDR